MLWAYWKSTKKRAYGVLVQDLWGFRLKHAFTNLTWTMRKHTSYMLSKNFHQWFWKIGKAKKIYILDNYSALHSQPMTKLYAKIVNLPMLLDDKYISKYIYIYIYIGRVKYFSKHWRKFWWHQFSRKLQNKRKHTCRPHPGVVGVEAAPTKWY